MKKLMVAAAALVLAGCLGFDSDTGTDTKVGEVTVLPTIQDASGSWNMQIYESVEGARVRTSKNCITEVNYECVSTNSVFGIYESQSRMKLRVKVQPCEVTTNAVEEASVE